MVSKQETKITSKYSTKLNKYSFGLSAYRKNKYFSSWIGLDGLIQQQVTLKFRLDNLMGERGSKMKESFGKKKRRSSSGYVPKCGFVWIASSNNTSPLFTANWMSLREVKGKTFENGRYECNLEIRSLQDDAIVIFFIAVWFRNIRNNYKTWAVRKKFENVY